ncbi:MAG: response regulator transcription factor [Ardenticatenaceae bacterium]|nr:response regulator transcription factor [Ardenticatenaceae bacterium]
MNSPLRVLVADKHTLTFYGLPQVLDEGQYHLLPDFARSYQEAYDYCLEYMPDVLVLAGHGGVYLREFQPVHSPPSPPVFNPTPLTELSGRETELLL